MADGVTTLTEDEVLDKVKGHTWGHIKVVCDAHRPMKYAAKHFVECDKPECQGVMAERRLAVMKAGAPSEEDTQRWRDWRKGLAGAKGGGA